MFSIQIPEMQSAVEELKAAYVMYNNAQNKWRMDEGWFRVQAAKSQIEAIRFEFGGENMVSTAVKQAIDEVAAPDITRSNIESVIGKVEDNEYLFACDLVSDKNYADDVEKEAAIVKMIRGIRSVRKPRVMQT